jgi:hypothetical protein
MRRAYFIGYDVAGSLLWGSDGFTPGYDPVYVRRWLELDRKILVYLDVREAAREQLFHRNLERFLAG